MWSLYSIRGICTTEGNQKVSLRLTITNQFQHNKNWYDIFKLSEVWVYTSAGIRYRRTAPSGTVRGGVLWKYHRKGVFRIHLLSCTIILKQEVCLPLLMFDLHENNTFLTVLVWVVRFSLCTQNSDYTDKKYWRPQFYSNKAMFS